MALVIRGTRRYVYKSVRKNGRVTSVYRGHGSFVELTDELASCDRVEAKLKRMAKREQRQRTEDADRSFAKWFQSVELVARAALVATGHYQHHGSEWRRRSNVYVTVTETAGEVVAADKSLPGPDIPLKDILKRAEAGDLGARFRLRAILEKEYVDLSKYEAGTLAEVTMVRPGTAGNLLIQEARIREIRRRADELAGTNPSPLERLLATRVSVCQFEVDTLEFDMAAVLDGARGNPTRDDVEYRERRVDRANRRLLQAVKTLAIVRRLGATTPTVQLNVTQMVNVEAKQEEVSPILDIPTLTRCSPLE